MCESLPNGGYELTLRRPSSVLPKSYSRSLVNPIVSKGCALLLRTTPEIEFIDWEDPQNPWGHCLGTLEVIDLPGHHQNVFEQPSVRVLADRLSDYLRTLERTEGGDD